MAPLTARQRKARAVKAYDTRRKNGNTPAGKPVAAIKEATALPAGSDTVKLAPATDHPRTQIGPTIYPPTAKEAAVFSEPMKFGSYVSDLPGPDRMASGDELPGYAMALAPLALPKKMAWPTQREAMHYYGNPLENTNAWAHDNLVHVPCPWALYMGEAHIPFIQIHKKCAASLAEVLAYVWAKIGKNQAEAHRLGYDVFSGSWNIRNMRGGSNISMHSYGCAIDFNAPMNAQHSHHGLFGDQSPLIEAFKAAGWEWGGDWSGNSVDPMHVQAAHVHG